MDKIELIQDLLESVNKQYKDKRIDTILHLLDNDSNEIDVEFDNLMINKTTYEPMLRIYGTQRICITMDGSLYEIPKDDYYNYWSLKLCYEQMITDNRKDENFNMILLIIQYLFDYIKEIKK